LNQVFGADGAGNRVFEQSGSSDSNERFGSSGTEPFALAGGHQNNRYGHDYLLG
jgi:hypothetical protein